MGEQLWAPVAGRYGRTRHGWMVGPIKRSEGGLWWKGWCDRHGGYLTFRDDGTYTDSALRSRDLVSEWSDDTAPAQPIDIHEVVAGDLLELRVKVDRIENGRPVVYSAHAPGMARVADVWPQDIIRHIHMRQFIEEDCVVALDGGGRGKVLKTWEGMAWVIRLRNGQPEPCAPCTWPFDRLQRLDSEPT